MRAFSKWSVRVIGLVMGIVVLGLLAFALWPVQVLVPEPRDLKQTSSEAVGNLVGWYDISDGIPRLISFSETSGITLNRFAHRRDELEQTYFKPSTDVIFVRAVDDMTSERLEFRLDEQDRVLGLTWTASKREREGTPSSQPPYSVEEVYFSSGEVELCALLLQPTVEASGPAVVFIHGSGVSHRNIFWYLHQADYLARHGITVLLPDKRGTGRSAGTWHDVDFDAYAQDAAAAVQFLDDGIVDSDSNIGLVAVSQGAWVAPLVASRQPRVEFVVSVSGSIRSPRNQLDYEVKNDIHNSGAPRWVAHLLGPLAARRAAKRQPTWWKLNGAFSPLGDWQSLTLPILFIFGADDQNVDVAANVAQLRATGLADARHVQVQVLEGLAHGLMNQQTGWVDEGYLSLLADWITRAH